MDLSFIEELEKFNEKLAKYDDVAGEIKNLALKENNILSTEQLKAQIEKVNEEGRLLSIGIIGRAKAGKSSLLNSLFFKGDDILPKAATPMTAALTIITYGETPKAIIENFNKSDVAVFEKEYNEWETVYKNKLEAARQRAEENYKTKKIPIEENRINRSVNAEMKTHPTDAGHDQYSRMLASGLIDTIYNSDFTPIKEIPADTIDLLMNELDDYVGAEGKYMPFTKSVQLFLNNEALRDIQIVDTPGVNDPIKSREKRTQDFLGECDVVFVVSPAGQFLSQEDLNLMALSSGSKGIQKIYLIASRSDEELLSNEKEDANGVLPAVISSINEHLAEYANETLVDLKKQNPEVGEAYDELINDGARHVIITSSICHAMSLKYNNRDSWDDDMNYTWSLLMEEYPDFFTDPVAGKANLDLLSGLSKVEAEIKNVRNDKDKIIEEKQSVFVSKQKETLEKYFTSVKQGLCNYKTDMESKDIDTIRKEKNNLEILQKSASAAVDDTFEETAVNFKITLKQKLKTNSKGLLTNITDEVNQSEKTEVKVETKKENRQVEKKGLFSWIARKLGWGGYEYIPCNTSVEKEIRTLRTASIISSLNHLASEIADSLNETAELAIIDWKKCVQSEVVTSIREHIDDVDMISIPALKDSLRAVFNRLDLPEFNLSAVKYQSNYSGILYDEEIDEFRKEFENYISVLSNEYLQQISNFISSFEKSISNVKISEKMFGEMNHKLEKLELDLSNKQIILERLNSCIKELSE